MSKLLTVVTSTYNKGDRNIASIQSILDQTFTDFEYIIVNDGSPDNTKETLDKFSDPRLKVIHQKNKGFTQTMVSIMKEIETPYVAIQGAGDISLPKRLEEQIQYLEANPDVGVVSCHSKTLLTANNISIEKLKKYSRERKKRIIYTHVEQMIKGNFVSHGEAMIRMSAYQDSGGYRPFFRYAQDRDLWLRILEKYSIAKINDLLYLRINDPDFDILGNPKKSEVQALYSLFARHLANYKIVAGEDLLEKRGDEAFKSFTKKLSIKNKQEVIGKIFRNSLKNPDSVEIAIEIIRKYSPNHSYISSLKIFYFLSKKIPFGRQSYIIYYTQVRHRLEIAFYKFQKLLDIGKKIIGQLVPFSL